MIPILIRIGPLDIHTYGFMVATGVLLGILLSFSLAKREKIDLRIFSDLVFFSILAGLIGSKLMLIFTDLKFYIENPSQLITLIRSAGTFYGGLILGLLFALWYIKKRKLPLATVADIFGPSMALAHFFGRLGCFFAGCCWGRACHHFFAITFSSKEALTGVPLFTPLYPTQLIEAVLNLTNFIFLIVIYKKNKYKGKIFLLYILNYSLIRFGIEYFRGDPDRGYLWGSMSHPFTSISIPQLISIIGIIISLFFMVKMTRSKKNLDPKQ